jgi:hypothetical protein
MQTSSSHSVAAVFNVNGAAAFVARCAHARERLAADEAVA